MAVTVNQSPTTPNVTNTNLVYTLGSLSSSNAQFRYVTDIYESGSGDFITRIRTYPNLYGSGIIDVARELNDQLGYDLNWKVSGSIAAINNVNTFDLRFGEEYAPSISGSITLYTGSTSNYLQVFPGTVYKNEGSYNFNTTAITTASNILSNTPEAVINPEVEEYVFVGADDYHTITVLDADASIGINLYDTTGTFVSQSVVSADAFGTIGIGPANLTWNVDFTQMSRITVSSLGTPNYSIWLPGYDKYPCSEEYTRFAFINEYGFWDYYNVYNPLRSSNQVDRSLYDKTFVRYEDSISGYNISNRGTTQYRTEYNKSYIITTDYITKQISDWLTELFESPEVFIQTGDNFIPINITNTNIRWNMNTSREKLFQYDIEFKYANQPQSR